MQNRIQKILVLDSYGDAHVAQFRYGHTVDNGKLWFTATIDIPQYLNAEVGPDQKYFLQHNHKKDCPVPGCTASTAKPWFATVVYPPDAQRTGVVLKSTYKG